MRKPEGHEPSVPAWSVVWPEHMTHLVFAQFGVQAPLGADSSADVARILELLDIQAGPEHIDRARHEDAAGYTNDIVLAYWRNPATYQTWATNESVAAWWADVDDSVLGHWREVATIPTERMETLHSDDGIKDGCANFLPTDVTPYHEYWGGARDRILASQRDDLATPLVGLPQAEVAETRGRRVKATAPKNVCLIRTGQDWTRCSEAERATYLETVEPVLHEAAVFNRDHPHETGCIAPRYVRELDLTTGDDIDRSCVIAWWLSLEHLEKWTMSHPTHKAIFATFFKMLEKHNYRIGLHLWHEVSVLPTDTLELEYVNCHPATSFLPFFAEAAVTAPPQAVHASAGLPS
jgi:Haem-containing dehydratase